MNKNGKCIRWTIRHCQPVKRLNEGVIHSDVDDLKGKREFFEVSQESGMPT